MKKQVGEYNIEIKQDENPENPREWNNITKIYCFHDRYDLEDKHQYKSKNFSSWDEFKRQIIKDEKPLIILPLYAYIHGGITISTKPFSCVFDSGQIGFILIKKETVSKEKINLEETVSKEKIDLALLAELETYNQYLQGEVYGYVITDNEFNRIHSCWGYYNEQYCMEEAENFINNI